MGRLISSIIAIAVASAVPCILGVALVLSVTPAFAEGAVALGRPDEIAKAGVAIGIASSYDDNTSAAKAALAKCQANKDAPPATLSLCRVLAYFRDQCAAVALDKKAGTPGFGWSIGIDKASAQQEALAACKATAGKVRERFCEQAILFCDGTAK
jgi:Domain of unknown function (DUF4189)